MNARKIYRIFGSFSGGNSSAVMCAIIRNQYPLAEVRFGMANTGEETEHTLRFAQEVDSLLALNLALVEAIVHPGKKKAATHRTVSFEEASRKAEPFHSVIKKYGIPTLGHLHCTRELKTNPLRSYLKETGWNPGTYRIALGFRSDELTRINPAVRNSAQFVYPLAEAGMDLTAVQDFVTDWPFKLEQPAHEGNCKTCHKKSELKTIINIKNHREWFDFPNRMDLEHGNGRKRYRGHRTTAEMIALADAMDSPDPRVLSNEETGCSTSCEPWDEQS